MPPSALRADIDRGFVAMKRARDTFVPKITSLEVGTVTTVSTGIATISGLGDVGFEELIRFPGDLFGIAFNLDEEEVGVVLLGEYAHINAGDPVARTGQVMDVAVGGPLIGRVIDPLGRPLDGKGPVAARQRLPIEREAKAIMDR